MKRFFALFLALMMLTASSAFATEEEEVSLSDALMGFETLPAAPSNGGKGQESPMPEKSPDGDAVGEMAATPGKAEVLPDGSVAIVISAVGDVTIGDNARKRGVSIFEKEKRKQGDDPAFVMRNVRDIFAEDQLTIANFEGTLTTTKSIPAKKRDNEFLFSAPPEYVSVLNAGNIEAVSFENNHVMDFGDEGNRDTRAQFEKAGIVYSADGHMGVYETNGISIAMLAYQTFNGKYPELHQRVPEEVAAAKKKHDIVIVSFHWGNEKDYVPNSKQVALGRATIDAGADLVIGHHSHRINPIEKYKGRYIAYSLGNFSFAGNSRPSDMSTYILQVRFIVKDGEVQRNYFRIIPGRISSKADYNDFAPTPFTEQKMIDNVINLLKGNGKKLEYAVESYPTQWE